MRVAYHFILLYFFLFCFIKNNAQAPFYYVNATTYTEKEGYSIINRVNYITEDNAGLIWIASENGLQSFNGTHFKTYRHSSKDPKGLPGNFVQYIYQDRKGIYWVYIRDKGLYNYDPQNELFSKFSYRNEKEFNLHQSYNFQVGLPFEDRKGRLWLPLLGYGIAEIQRDSNLVTPYKICIPGNCGSFYNASYVTRIFEDDKGGFWLATNGGLVFFNPKTGVSEEIIEPDLQKRSNPIERRSVFNYFGPQIKNDLWIGTWGSGIKRLNTITKKIETFLWHPKTWDGTKNICTGIWLKDSANLWVSTLDKELFVFNLHTREFRPVRVLDTEDLSFVGHETIQTRDGSLWMTHINKTLVKINKQQFFSSYALKNPNAIIPSNLTANCFLTINNNLYIGAGSDTRIYEYHLPDQAYRTYSPPGKYLRGETNFLLPAKELNGFYAGGYYGLAFFNIPSRKFESLKADSITGRILKQELICATRGKDNSIWIGPRNKNNLLRYFPQTGSLKEYPIIIEEKAMEMPQTDYWINKVVVGKNDYIWFSHSHFGLGSLHIPNGKIVFFNSFRKKGYPIGFSTDVIYASDGSIYFTILGEGVWRLRHPFTNREEMVNYDRSNGLPSDMIRFVHQDRKKNLWFFSSNGLSLFDPASATSKNFSVSDGLKNKNLAYRPYEDSSGQIYIGFNRAFQSFHSDSLLAKKIQTSKLIVHELKINNVPWNVNVNYTNELVLKPNQNYLQFQYAAITHDNPEQLSYSYILEGFDKDWINAGPATLGNYNNLPPGDYTLKIKLNDRDEAHSNYFELPIIIKGYWYKSTWFKVSLALFVLLLIFIALRYRIGVHQHEARLKAEFAQRMAEVEMRALRAQMNPHFIFNCLSSINRYIVKSDHKTASGYLTKFSKLIRLILDNSAADMVSIEKELQSLQLYIDMEVLRFDHAFSYTIQVDESLDREENYIPSMLLQPYVENAIWHGLLHKESEDGKLTINLVKKSENLLIAQIEDNGIGRLQAKELKSKEAEKKKSLGMQISRDRLALLNGKNGEAASVLIEDLVNKTGNALGTRVILNIPMQKLS